MKRKIVIGGCAAIALVLAWFLAVDRSWFIDSCPTCGFSSDVIQYRFFNFCVKQDANEHDTILQHVATDLGAACTHPEATRWHKHRYWGLLICAAPCQNGISGMVGNDSWYDATATAKIQALVQSKPSLRDEFRERVLKNHDREFFATILEDAGLMQTTEEEGGRIEE